MQRQPFARYLNPWTLSRDKQQRRFEELRSRDGDHCRRCKRAMQFDLPPGHDQAPTVEQLKPKSNGGSAALDNLCLCHRRCNWAVGDSTLEVTERVRLRAEEAVPPKRRAAGGR